MTEKPSAAAIQRLRHIFEACDKHGTGKVSRSKMTIVLRKLVPALTLEEMKALFDAVNPNMQAEFSFDDFISFVYHEHPDAAHSKKLHKDNSLQKLPTFLSEAKHEAFAIMTAGMHAPGENSADSKRYKRVYDLLQRKGTFHRKRLASSLHFLGYGNPDERWIRQAIDLIEQMYQLQCEETFSEQVWTHLVAEFEVYHQREYFAQLENLESVMQHPITDSFSKRSKQRQDDRPHTSATSLKVHIKVEELKTVLDSIGIRARAEVVHEAFKDAQQEQRQRQYPRPDGRKAIFDVLERTEMLVRRRHGFTKREIGLLMKAYQNIPSNVPVAETLAKLSSWMDFSIRHDQIVEALHDLGLTRKTIDRHHLNKNLFLAMLRALYDCEEKHISEFISSAGEHHVTENDILGLVQHVGYSLTHCELKYFLAEANLSFPAGDELQVDNVKGMSKEDFWKLLCGIRIHEGFGQEELKVYCQAFDYFAQRENGYLNERGLKRALSWLGLMPVTIKNGVEQHLLQQVDLSRQGYIGVPSFLRLIRHSREFELLGYEKMFRYFSKDQGHGYPPRGTVPNQLQSVCQILASLGYAAGEERVTRAMGVLSTDGQECDELSFLDFVNVADAYRDAIRDDMRETALFSEEEVRKLKKCFHEFDHDDTGELSGDELRKLILELFPGLDSDLAKHERICKLIDQVSAEKAENLSSHRHFHFGEFLWFMQFALEESDDELRKKEEAAILECGYSSVEVDQFRQVYREVCNFDDNSELPWFEVAGVLRRFMHISKDQEGKLKPLLEKADKDGNKRLDFPEFLSLMRHLQNENFKRINEEAADAQHALEKEEYAVTESLFKQSEVEALRKAFAAFKSRGEEVTQDERHKLLDSFITPSDQVVKDLLEFMDEVDSQGQHRLTFPVFLLLMQWLSAGSRASDTVTPLSLRAGFESAVDKLDAFASSKGWSTCWAPSQQKAPPVVGKRGRKGRRAKQG
eukprot:gnl/MRDRNA2_/MRDRNA2_120497_c0_seq1.p1 gnl/MRDRNA2_/MRDRNA2_120497_c0~~gnl/MRDRNA2_/MRDRNA2_120497_c0_seq1.p1  ORF type:complete len:975 (-),score=206.08 gnl/MRDRNA2_/MRDRNA2_120497_c0_seq1:124-3048(-)